MAKSRKEIIARAESFGLYIETWAPGDGAVRYRLFARPTDYHAGNGLFTALGLRELDAFVTGWIARGQNND